MGVPTAAGIVHELSGASHQIVSAVVEMPQGSFVGPLVYDAAGQLFGTTDSGVVYQVPADANFAVTPQLVTAPAAQTAVARVSTSFSLGSYVDELAGSAPYTVNVNWGDNTANTIFTVASAGDVQSAMHTYTAQGTDTATVTITNAQGHISAPQQFTVSVAPVSTSLTLLRNGSATSNATQSLSFTAAFSGGVPDGETVTLEDASNKNAVVATATTSGVANLTIPAGTLLGGTHNLVAVYGGDSSFLARIHPAHAKPCRSSSPPRRWYGQRYRESSVLTAN